MYHFIVNIRGGSGKAFIKWNKIRAMLAEKKVEYKAHITQHAGHASELAKEISELKEDDIKIVVVGGDGAINEVINGISDFSRIKLGLIPTGSGNDFSRGLKLPRHNPRKALELILNSKGDKKIDLGRATVPDSNESRLFGISSGFGLDAIVGTSINTSRIKKILNFLHLGNLSYAFYTVQMLFTMKTFNATLRFDDDEQIEFKKIIFLANMNFKAEGGGVPMAPKAKGNDGKLSMCLAYGVPKIITFFAFPLLCMGVHEKMPVFYLRNYRKLEVESRETTVLNTDGEFLGSVKKARWEVVPAVLTMLI